METRIDEIGAGAYRISVFVPDAAPPAGFMFNHFLFDGEEPLLFHCGKRTMFPLVSAAVARIMPVEQPRWLGFGHFEAHERGSMNGWLAAAPAAQLAHGMVGYRASVSDLEDSQLGTSHVVGDGLLITGQNSYSSGAAEGTDGGGKVNRSLPWRHRGNPSAT